MGSGCHNDSVLMGSNSGRGSIDEENTEDIAVGG